MKDMLSEAERRQAVQIALAARARTRGQRLAATRMAIALQLLRLGAWLLPDDARPGASTAAGGALELRLGR
jgi:hypothetical protein